METTIRILKRIILFIFSFVPHTILQRYIFKSIFPYFYMGIFIFSLVNLVQYLSDFVSLAIQYQAPLWSVLKTVFYLIPFLMTFTIPIGVLIGVILTLGHLTQNNEIIAIRTNGVSYFNILKPALFFGFVLFLFQLVFFQWILPWGNTNFLKEKYKMLQKNPLSQIQKKQSFSDGLRELKIANINNETLYGVSFIDTQTNILYYSKTGHIKPSIDAVNFNIPITLYNASAIPYIFDKASTNISLQFFDEITVYIKAVNVQSVVPEGSELIGLTQLNQSINARTLRNISNTFSAFHKMIKANNELNKAQTALTPKHKLTTKQQEEAEEYVKKMQNDANFRLNNYQAVESRILVSDDIFLFQRKIAFAIDAILMTLLGIPLALFKKRQGKDIAIGISVICVFIFNLLLALSNFAFKQHIMGPYLAAWFPSILILFLSLSIIAIKFRTI